MVESANVERVRAIIASINQMDIESVIAMAAEDIVVNVPFAVPGQPETQQGRDSFVVAMEGIPVMFSRFTLQINHIYDVPDQDVVLFEMESNGEFAINGTDYGNRYMMLFGFRDGELCLWREYYNSLILQEQMAPIFELMQG